MAVSAKRNAKVEITSSASGLDRGLNDARRKMRSFARDQAKDDKAAEKAAKARGKAVSGFALGVGGAVGARAISFVSDGAQGVVDFERGLVRLQIASRKTTEQMGDVRSSINATSLATGMSREEVLKGAQAWVDLAGAEALTDTSMRTIARTAQATGSSVNDVVTMMYSLGDAMKVDPSQMESTLSGLNNLSKDGAVHFNQMAGEIIALAPQFARFGITGREGAIELGAMFQVIRTGSKDAADTATKMDAMMRGLKLHSDRFEKAGVAVYKVGKDGTKSFLPLSQILDGISHSELMKDPQKLAKAFGRGEGEAGEFLLSKHIELMKQLIASGQDAKSIGEDLNTVLDSPVGKMDTAINKLKLTLVETFTPERIEAFGRAISDAAERMQPVIEGFSKILGFIGTLYSVGRKVRGLLPGGDGHIEDNAHDLGLARGDAYELERADNLGWSPEELAHRRAAAKQNVAFNASHNAAIDKIMGAESDDKSTPASIAAAMAAKYSGGPASGAHVAGDQYLTAAGYVDPFEREQKRIQSMGSDAAMAKMAQTIAAAISQIQINLDGTAVGKGVSNSMGARKGAAKSGR